MNAFVPDRRKNDARILALEQKVHELTLSVQLLQHEFHAVHTKLDTLQSEIKMLHLAMVKSLVWGICLVSVAHIGINYVFH